MNQDEIFAIGVLVFLVLLISLASWHTINPKNPVTGPVGLLWNSARILRYRAIFEKSVWTACSLFFGAIALYYYFNESGFYPRERDTRVYFKAQSWIDGEIQSCISVKTTTRDNPDAEVEDLSCSYEQQESHTLRVTFWGPIVADRTKLWKCERSRTRVTCKLQ